MPYLTINAKKANSTGVCFYKGGKLTEIKNGVRLRVTKETKTTYQFKYKGETHSIYKADLNFLFTIKTRSHGKK